MGETSSGIWIGEEEGGGGECVRRGGVWGVVSTDGTQWNTSHIQLERGTYFITIQMQLHHRTAWNDASTTTTLNMSCSKLALSPDHYCRSHATSIRKQSLQDPISIFAKACLVGLPVPIHNGIVYACRKGT